MNQKGWGATRPPKITLPYQPTMPSEIVSFPFPQKIDAEQYYIFPGVEYEFNLKKSSNAGPLYEKKALKLELR